MRPCPLCRTLSANAANPKCFDGNATIRISFTLVTTLDVDMESGCALWGGAVDDRGYGV
jgi:hypothetical protein